MTASLKHEHLVVCNNLGKVSIRSLDDFNKKICSLKQAKHWCEVAKYSPDESHLAVGSHDDHLYIYEVRDDGTYHLVAKDHRNHSWINAIDWTTDSQEIRTSSGDYEVLYYNVAEKQPNPHGSETTKDKEWASNTVKYGKDREDIKPSSEDRTHVNDVCGTRDHTLLMSSDDFSLVNVFHFPNPTVNDSRSYCGHSEHVCRIQMTQDQKRVFTIGGQDKALIQWKIVRGEVPSVPVKVIEESKVEAAIEKI